MKKNNNSSGGMLAAVVAVPVMVVCCAGGLGLSASVLAGSAAYFSGTGIVVAALVVGAMAIAALAVRRYLRGRGSPATTERRRGISDAQ